MVVLCDVHVISFPPGVYVVTLSLIASIPGLSILHVISRFAILGPKKEIKINSLLAMY